MGRQERGRVKGREMQGQDGTGVHASSVEGLCMPVLHTSLHLRGPGCSKYFKLELWGPRLMAAISASSTFRGPKSPRVCFPQDFQSRETEAGESKPSPQ